MSQWKRDELLRLIAELEGAEARASNVARSAERDARVSCEKGSILATIDHVVERLRQVVRS